MDSRLVQDSSMAVNQMAGGGKQGNDLFEKCYKFTAAKELQQAAALGDLRKKGEYESARNRQDYLRLRIATLRKRLADLSMLDIDRLPRDRAGSLLNES